METRTGLPGTRRAGVVRRAVTALCALVLRVFFRRIEVVGQAPAAGPVVFVLNHPNGLLDPLFLLALAPRPVSFLAKAPLFRAPLVGTLVRALDCLPVYRAADGADTRRNRGTLEAAGDLLMGGGAIALFPEGTTRDAHALAPLKSGAARIALGTGALLGAAGAAPPALVPAGLYYGDRGTFRSDAVMVLGPAIPFGDLPMDPDAGPAPDAVSELTARVASALRALTVNAERSELVELAATAARLLEAQDRPAAGAGGIQRRLELMQSILAHHEALRAQAPASVRTLVDRLRRYRAARLVHGMDEEAPDRVHAVPAARFLARTLALAVPGAPLIGAGMLVNWLPYRLVGTLARRIAGDQEAVLSTGKVLAGMVLFPATWLLVSAGVAGYAGWQWGLVHLLLAPACAGSALWWLDRSQAIAAGFRVLWLKWRRPAEHACLLAEREAIARELREHAQRNRGPASPD